MDVESRQHGDTTGKLTAYTPHADKNGKPTEIISNHNHPSAVTVAETIEGLGVLSAGEDGVLRLYDIAKLSARKTERYISLFPLTVTIISVLFLKSFIIIRIVVVITIQVKISYERRNSQTTVFMSMYER